MFSRSLAAFLQYAPFDFSRVTRPARKPFVGGEALKWPGDMKLSARMERPGDYAKLQRARRDALESILREEPTEQSVRDAVDLICAILEESSWALIDPNEPFDDETFPPIDFSRAETAALFGWTACILGERLDGFSPLILPRMLSEVRKRVFRSAAVHEDYPFMQGENAYSLSIAVDLAVTAIFLERDAARLSRLLKSLFQIIDTLSGMHGRFYIPLEESATDIASVSDLVYLIGRLTGGAMDLSRSAPDRDWTDELLFSWISEDNFVDPAGASMKPPISGMDLFRIGRVADDKDLAALGAQLHRMRRIAPRTVNGRMLESAFSDALEANMDKPPRLKYAVLRGNRLMSVRMGGLFCAMHTGGGQSNVGDICMFLDGNPVFPYLNRTGEARNTPKFNALPQLERPERPCIADFSAFDDRETLSIDLTNAYPEGCALASYQRTVLAMRREYVLRIVEAVRFTKPSTAEFTFVCAAHPTILSSAIRFGQLRLTWEGDLDARERTLENGMTELTLASTGEITDCLYTFNFELP